MLATSKRYFTTRTVDRFFITSGLYVPGNQERMLNKCVTTKATLLVPDIEDSVPVEEKPKARIMIRDKLKQIRDQAYSPKVVITPRTNGITTGLFYVDVKELLNRETIPVIDGFCVPKVDTPQEYREIDSFISSEETNHGLSQGHFKLIPQIESTLSMINAKDIFQADQQGRKRIIAAAFGADDFTADFEIDRSDNDKELDFVRKFFSLTCHAYGVISIDTPYVHFKNLDGLKQELVFLKSIGMKAKFAIHPTQVDVINSVLKPSPEEVAYYKAMVEKFEEAQIKTGKAAIEFHGKMIDIAAYRRAKAILKRSE